MNQPEGTQLRADAREADESSLSWNLIQSGSDVHVHLVSFSLDARRTVVTEASLGRVPSCVVNVEAVAKANE